MEIIKHLSRESWRPMALVIITSVIAGIAAAALIVVIGNAVADGGNRGSLAAFFFAICIVIVITTTVSEIALLRITQGLVLRLRLLLSRKLLSTPQRLLQSIGKDELTMILTRDIDTFASAFQGVPRCFSSVIVLLSCLVYMAYLSPVAVLLYLVTLVVCVGGYSIAERKPMAELVKAREQAQYVQADFRDLIDGSRELQLNAVKSSQFLEGVLDRDARKYAALYVSSMSRYAVTNNIGNVLFFQAIGVLLFIAPTLVSSTSAITAKLVFVMLYMIRPIGDLMILMPTMRQAAVSWQRVQRLGGKLGGAQVELPQTSAFGTEFRSLSLRRVVHKYGASDEDRFTVGPLSLEILPAEILFITGGNGTGKTTLAMLLLGLYEPSGGEVVLNGTKVTDDNRALYRQMFSAIFSDGHLFREIPASQHFDVNSTANAYLSALGLRDIVRVVDGKFSTIALSMGQRKRLALVASYLEDRPIYVFDEWAADQDPLFKKVFYTKIAKDLKAKGKAVVIISHDDAYFSHADRTIKLDSGTVHDAGAPCDGDLRMPLTEVTVQPAIAVA